MKLSFFSTSTNWDTPVELIQLAISCARAIFSELSPTKGLINHTDLLPRSTVCRIAPSESLSFRRTLECLDIMPFKFTLFVLLCAVVIGTPMKELFTGCVVNQRDRGRPGKCVLLPEQEHRHNQMFMMLAEQALKRSTHGPTSRYVHAFSEMKRVALQVSSFMILPCTTFLCARNRGRSHFATSRRIKSTQTYNQSAFKAAIFLRVPSATVV